MEALEDAKEEKAAHGEIETFHPGFLLGQDTFYVGWIKGIIVLLYIISIIISLLGSLNSC